MVSEPKYKMVNGEQVELTPEEIAWSAARQREAAEAIEAIESQSAPAENAPTPPPATEP